MKRQQSRGQEKMKDNTAYSVPDCERFFFALFLANFTVTIIIIFDKLLLLLLFSVSYTVFMGFLAQTLTQFIDLFS